MRLRMQSFSQSGCHQLLCGLKRLSFVQIPRSSRFRLISVWQTFHSDTDAASRSAVVGCTGCWPRFPLCFLNKWDYWKWVSHITLCKELCWVVFHSPKVARCVSDNHFDWKQFWRLLDTLCGAHLVTVQVSFVVFIMLPRYLFKASANDRCPLYSHCSRWFYHVLWCF